MMVMEADTGSSSLKREGGISSELEVMSRREGLLFLIADH